METTKTDNELIAEFLGWERYSQNSFKCPNTYPIKGDHGWTTFSASELNFMNSWDWLMPVVRKIITMTSATNIGDFDIKDRYQAVMLCGTLRKNLTFADINSVCHSVTEFIKWHNSQKL